MEKCPKCEEKLEDVDITYSRLNNKLLHGGPRSMTRREEAAHSIKYCDNEDCMRYRIAVVS